MTGQQLIRWLREQMGAPTGCPICGGHLVGTECEDCGTDFAKEAKAL